MATTVQAADLQVTITESYSLNGVSYGNTVNKIYSSNGEIVQRVMAIQSQGRGANWTDILNFGAADSAGQVDVSNYKYFRITNLDDTNFLELRITGASNTSYFVKVKAGESYLLMDNEMDAETSSTTVGTLADVTAIAANANTDGIDIEFMCVTAQKMARKKTTTFEFRGNGRKKRKGVHSKNASKGKRGYKKTYRGQGR